MCWFVVLFSVWRISVRMCAGSGSFIDRKEIITGVQCRLFWWMFNGEQSYPRWTLRATSFTGSSSFSSLPLSAETTNTKRNFHTRMSSCVNTRGIPTAAYQVLARLSCPGRGGGGIPSKVRTGEGTRATSSWQGWGGCTPGPRGRVSWKILWYCSDTRVQHYTQSKGIVGKTKYNQQTLLFLRIFTIWKACFEVS